MVQVLSYQLPNRSLAQPKQFEIVANVIASLCQTLQELYQSIEASPAYADCRLPCYRSYTCDSVLPDFKYLGPMENRVCLFEAMAKANFRLIVEFTDRYSKLAHRILAEEGLAPRLYSISPVVEV